MSPPARDGTVGNHWQPAVRRGRLVDDVDGVVAIVIAEEQDNTVGIHKSLDGRHRVAVEDTGVASRRAHSRVPLRFPRALSVLIQREVPLDIVPLRFHGAGRHPGDYRRRKSSCKNDSGPEIHGLLWCARNLERLWIGKYVGISELELELCLDETAAEVRRVF